MILYDVVCEKVVAFCNTSVFAGSAPVPDPAKICLDPTGSGSLSLMLVHFQNLQKNFQVEEREMTGHCQLGGMYRREHLKIQCQEIF